MIINSHSDDYLVSTYKKLIKVINDPQINAIVGGRFFRAHSAFAHPYRLFENNHGIFCYCGETQVMT